jgi:hypothetical protein
MRPIRFLQVQQLAGMPRGNAEVLWDEEVMLTHHRAPQRATIALRRRIRIPWWP